LILPSLGYYVKIYPMDTKIVFMGSPDFGVPTLKALIDEFNVVGVVTQPDRPAGRGRKLTPPPIKTLAEECGLPVIQPLRLRQPEAIDQLQNWQPDVIVVAAFGQILRPQVLDIPIHGCINVHASLLPRWRGAAPIRAAILHGDSQTGVTIMLMDAGVDTGPILSQRAVPIEAGDNAETLSNKLAHIGADLLIDTLPGYLSGQISPTSQENELATYAPMLEKSDGELDFTRPAVELERQVRAFYPWPGAYTHIWQGERLKVLHASVVQPSDPGDTLEPGQRTLYQDLPAISTERGFLVLEEVQPAGKKPMNGEAFLRGARDWM
jgi:methionyl-tRNA formyltransferase